MPRKRARSPQEKKTLSYRKDRRNTHGENDKASRKLIPLRKALDRRADRRKTQAALDTVARATEAAKDVVESSARKGTGRIGGWVKWRDTPLGKVVAAKLRRRRRQ
jgi:hypothetical protein